MSFLRDYAIFTKGNEAPPLYHTWAGISVLSSIVSRKVWVNQGIFTIYPNLYVILVGEPGNGKTTALSIARRMVRSFSHIPISPSAITREAMTEMMGDEKGPCQKTFKYNDELHHYCHLTVFANELVTMLGNPPEKMVELFTDIWDQEAFEVKTKHQGHDIIKGPYVTLLGCMTPEITSNLLKQSIISGGFARRCVFVNALDRGDPVPRPIITPQQEAAWLSCLEWGKKIKDVQGEFQWTQAAFDFFDEWYLKKYAALADHHDMMTKGYYRSKDVLLLKVAMLIVLSETTELVLDAPHLEASLAFLDQAEVHLNRVFDGTGRNMQADLAARVLHMIESKGSPVIEKVVYGTLYADGTRDEIRQVIEHLVATDKIKVLEKALRPGQPKMRHLATLKMVQDLAQTGQVSPLQINLPNLGRLEE